MWGCFSRAPYWGPGPQPRHVPWLGIEPATLWFSGRPSIHWATPARAIPHCFRQKQFAFLGVPIKHCMFNMVILHIYVLSTHSTPHLRGQWGTLLYRYRYINILYRDIDSIIYIFMYSLGKGSYLFLQNEEMTTETGKFRSITKVSVPNDL